MTAGPTPLDLDELERLLSEATAGLWVASEDLSVVDEFGSMLADCWSNEDAALIVAMRNALPALVERARAADTAEQTLARAEAALAQIERMRTFVEEAMVEVTVSVRAVAARNAYARAADALKIALRGDR